MADNTVLNAQSGGAGDTIATDDIGGVKHQLVKIEYGAADSATQVSDANPLPVDDAGGTLTVDDGGLTLSVDDGAGSLTVDVGTALPAGTNAIGKLAANSGVDIGDVDVTSMPGTAAEAAALPSVFVVIAGDDGTDTQPVQLNASGAVKVDGSAVTQPVSAASLPLPSGAATESTLSTLNGKVTACNTGAVTITSPLPAGTNAIGKLSPNSGIDIGDVDVTSIVPGTGGTNLGKNEDNPHSSGHTGVMALAVQDVAPAAFSGSDVDYEPLHVGANGGLWATQTPAIQGGLTTYHVVSAASTNAASVKASAGQLYGYYIYNSNASMRKVALHNTAGTPTAGSSVFLSIPIPPGSAANVEFNNGVAFSTGIGITTVTGIADSDATAVAANDLVVNLFYK